MFSERYRRMCNQIHPDEQLLEMVLSSAHKSNHHKNKNQFRARKTALALAIVFICLSFSIPVLAMNVEPIYQMMYTISPTVAQFFKPVQVSSEDKGIKMEVVSVYIHDNIAEIYITLKDLIGERIDETTDLFDSYSINSPFDSSASSQLISYEATTKTATFLIIISEWEKQNIVGEKITFTLNEFLGQKTIYEDIEIPVNLSSITNTERTQTPASMGGSKNDLDESGLETNPTVLIPSEAMKGFPVDGIDLTGIAFVSKKLHVQIAIENPLGNDNHGYFYLKDLTGDEISYSSSYSFSNQSNNKGRIDYHEYVFDLFQENISNYKLFGNFVTSKLNIEGKWQVTFPLQNTK